MDKEKYTDEDFICDNFGVECQQLKDALLPQAEPEIPKGSTCHFERDSKGEWWVVWCADFEGDKPGRKLCPESFAMECAYQQGVRDEREKWIKAFAYHGIKIENPKQVKRIIAQLKEKRSKETLEDLWKG
jgi:hypothetical protein